jgi:hypothetical protein
VRARGQGDGGALHRKRRGAAGRDAEGLDWVL